MRPTQPRPKLDRRDRKKRGDKSDAPKADAAVVGAAVAADAIGDVAIDEPGAKTGARSASRGRRGGSGRGPRNGTAVTDDAGTDAGDESTETPARTRTPARSTETAKESTVDAQQVGEEAQRFVQGLVDAFGVAGTTTVRRDGDDIEVLVEGSDLGLLVGPRGATLQSVQELTRVASQRRLGDHDTRLRVDIAGYRERRREALGRFAQQVAAQVVAEGAAKRLEPMSSADRKIVHDVLSEYDGVVTRSEGDDPQRCVVIAPAND